ncbi:MAG: TIM barrel protein [Chloroflexi bacterium]|nr:TIM barrel protein [Chloroflexota bacterium]
MIAYAVNVTHLMRGLPVREQLRRVAAAGFTAFELLFPQRIDLDELIAAKDEFGLTMALFDLNYDDRYPRGHLSHPEADDLFFAQLSEAIALARRLGVKRLNALAGLAVPGMAKEQQKELVAQRLRQAAGVATSEGITLLIEALNIDDNPGYFLQHSRDGFDIVGAVGSPNVKFQYDVYHMQLMEGNLINTIREHIGQIGHIQVADVPSRTEPGTGEIDYPNVLRAIEAAGYHGYVGLEYRPSRPDVDPFAWLAPEKRARSLWP